MTTQVPQEASVANPIAATLLRVVEKALSGRRITARALAAEIAVSHRHLIKSLKALPPNRINPFLDADENDLTLRAETLRCNIRAFERYVVAFMRDTGQSTWAMQLDRKHLDGLFCDLIGDLCGAIERAAERIREERANRAA